MDGAAAVFQANEFLWKEVGRLEREKRRLQEQVRHHQDQGRQVAELERRCARKGAGTEARPYWRGKLTEEEGEV